MKKIVYMVKKQFAQKGFFCKSIIRLCLFGWKIGGHKDRLPIFSVFIIKLFKKVSMIFKYIYHLFCIIAICSINLKKKNLYSILKAKLMYNIMATLNCEYKFLFIAPLVHFTL